MPGLGANQNFPLASAGAIADQSLHDGTRRVEIRKFAAQIAQAKHQELEKFELMSAGLVEGRRPGRRRLA